MSDSSQTQNQIPSLTAIKRAATSLSANDPSSDSSATERSVNNSGVIFFEKGVAVPVVNGWRETAFDAEPAEILAHLTPRERTTWELRMAALRYIAQIEPRTFKQIAEELGTTVAAVSRVYRDVLAMIGARRLFDNAEKRWKLAQAAKRTLNSRKAPSRGEERLAA